MYNDVLYEKKYNLNTYYHRLNPWVKILCFIIFSIIVIIQKDIIFIGIISILLINLILMSNVKLKTFLHILNKIKIPLVIIVLLSFIISRNITTTLVVLSKTLLISLYYSLIILTTDFDSVNYGFNKLLTPIKFLGKIVDKISLFVTSIFMFIPNLIQSKKEYLDSLSLRGMDYKSSKLVDKLKITWLVIKNAYKSTLIHNSNKKKALDIRMSNNHVTYSHKNFTFNDLFILFTHLFVVVVVIIKGVVL